MTVDKMPSDITDNMTDVEVTRKGKVYADSTYLRQRYSISL